MRPGSARRVLSSRSFSLCLFGARPRRPLSPQASFGSPSPSLPPRADGSLRGDQIPIHWRALLTRAPGGIGFGPATSLSAQSSGLVRLALAEPPSARRRIASRRSDPHPPAGAPDARSGRHRLRARHFAVRSVLRPRSARPCRPAVLPPCRSAALPSHSVLSSFGPHFSLAPPSPSLPPRADGSLRGDRIPIHRWALLTRAAGGIGFGLALAVLPSCRLAVPLSPFLFRSPFLSCFALAEPPSARRRIASRRSDPHPPAGAPDARCGRHRVRARSCRPLSPQASFGSPSPSLPPRADGSLRGDQIPIHRRALLTRAAGGIGFGPATSLSAQSSGLVRLALAEPPSARRRIASRRSDPHPPAGAPDARSGRHRVRARSCRLAVLPSCRLAVLPPCRPTQSSVLSSFLISCLPSVLCRSSTPAAVAGSARSAPGVLRNCG